MANMTKEDFEQGIKQGRYQGWSEAQIEKLLDDVAELKTQIGSINAWKSKIMGCSLAISGVVSFLGFLATIFLPRFIK